MRGRLPLPLGIPMMVLVAACGSTPSESLAPDDSPTAAVVPSLTSIEAGSTVKLVFTVHQADGTQLHPLGAAWRSSDLGIATVGDAGLVRGASVGTATVTADWQGAHGMAVITVVPAFTKKPFAPRPPCPNSPRIPPGKLDPCLS
jgi:hypothetical protein